MDDFVSQVVAALFLSLRIAPTFAFAPPFTLLRVPVTIRVLLAFSLAGWLVLGNPANSYEREVLDDGLLTLAAGELFIGMALALSLQWAFAAILTAGRAIDVQAGFGLALLIDPTSRAQMPLNGTVFAYGAAAVFFAIGGTYELLGVWKESLELIPMGAVTFDANIPRILSYISGIFAIAIGLAGIVLLALFLIDMTVAFLSRTLPQMNVLLIGFQIKTLVVLATVPVALAYSTAIFLRIIRSALQAAPEFL